MWQIEYYAEPSGRQPVIEWLENLETNISAGIQDKIDSLQKHGLILLNTNMMRPLKGYGGDFFEIKYSNYRIAVYYETTSQTFILLHGFKKERQRELKEIQKAYSRLRDYLARG
jgi:phage-related protein